MSTEKIMAPLTPEELDWVAARFRMLGEPMRLRILQSVCKGPRSVGDIVLATGSTQANVSKHLALLAQAGVLTRRKDGQCVFYGVKDPTMIRICELVRAQAKV